MADDRKIPWDKLVALSEVPAVHEALVNFSHDSHPDSGCDVIEQILLAAPPLPDGAVPLRIKRRLFEFSSESDWVNHARWRFENCGVTKDAYICLDAIGRLVQKGAEFMRASREKTYPVTVYEIE